MRIGLKPNVPAKRRHALWMAGATLSRYADWCEWSFSVKPALHINAHGWTIKAGERELTCENGEVLGDPWLYFWLTGDVTRMIPQTEHDLSDLAEELECTSLETLR